MEEPQRRSDKPYLDYTKLVFRTFWLVGACLVATVLYLAAMVAFSPPQWVVGGGFIAIFVASLAAATVNLTVWMRQERERLSRPAPESATGRQHGAPPAGEA